MKATKISTVTIEMSLNDAITVTELINIIVRGEQQIIDEMVGDIEDNIKILSSFLDSVQPLL